MSFSEFAAFYEQPYFKDLVHTFCYKLSDKGTIPTRNLETDAGMDIYASEDTFLELGTTTKIKTDIAIKIPNGFVGKIEGRSSMNSKGLITAGGVIDSGYNGEIGIVIHNFSNDRDFETNIEYTDNLPSHQSTEIGYKISKGDKIAQLLIYKVETPVPVEVKELWESNRGNNGFGSSGR